MMSVVVHPPNSLVQGVVSPWQFSNGDLKPSDGSVRPDVRGCSKLYNGFGVS
jgi:hypothetical protein